MKKVTRIVHEYTYTNGMKKCILHFVKFDEKIEYKRMVPHCNECWISGWNPMPISGKFYTSLSVFDEWMNSNGWWRCSKPTTIIIDREERQRTF